MSIFRFTTGPKILVDFGNTIIDEIEKGSWKPGSTLKKGGTLFDFIQTVIPTATHALKVYNTSYGSTPAISVVPGAVTDLIGFGISYIPYINGNPINVKIGSPLAYPKLTVIGSDSVIYLHLFIDSTLGTINPSATPSISVESDSTMPSSDDSNCYILLSNIDVTTGSNASVDVSDDGAQSSLYYAVCGAIPLIDGSEYRIGT